MTWYTFEVSNHPGAGARIVSDEAGRSWQRLHACDTTAKEARRVVDELSRWYKHARVFRGRGIGRLHYAVYRP